MKTALSLLGFSLIAFATEAYSAGSIPSFVNYYYILTDSLGLPKDFTAVFGGLFVLLLISILGKAYQAYAAKCLAMDGSPTGTVSAGFIVEQILEFVDGITEDLLGRDADRFRWLLMGLFFYILLGNLSGLIPGFPPPTENMSNNVAMGLVVFLVYNVAGFKEHGAGYLKQFVGPIVYFAPLMLVIELISHVARPLSLGLRLMGNIFGDHMLVAVFTGLTYFVVPSLLMFFGLLVACVQSFVFTLLSGVYISMAVSHDH